MISPIPWRLKSNQVYYATEAGDASLLPTNAGRFMGKIPPVAGPIEIAALATLRDVDNESGKERQALVPFMSGSVPVMQLRLTAKQAEALSRFFGILAESMEPEKVEEPKVIVPGA